MTPAESENRFDDLLRRKFAGDELQPSAGLWPAVSATLPPPPPRPRAWPVGAAAVLGVLLGLLMGWWAGPRPVEKGHFQRPTAIRDEMKILGSEKKVFGDERKTIGSKMKATGSEMKAIGIEKTIVAVEMKATGGKKMAVGSGKKVVGTEKSAVPTRSQAFGGSGGAAGTTTPGGAVSAPAAAALTLWQVALAQDAGIRHEGAMVPVRADSASRVPTLIAAQRATLRVLQRQLDSLKAALPAEPAALALADAVPPALVPDSATRPALPPLHRWAVAALAEATTPWGVLPGPADAREMLGAAAAQSIQVEHRLANDRWLVRGGLGGVRLTSYFRAATEKTDQTLVSDTVTTVQTEVFTRTDTTLILHPYSQLFLNPRVNAGGQIIGYDSVWVPRVDTLYQVVVAHDTVRRSTQIVQTRLDTWREWREQQMRPSYRFWTIPLAVQYDVLRARRWRAGVSGGAQVLIFRGGEAPVRVGEGYELRRVGPRAGPFRPVSVALTGGLDVRYRLSGRLSLLAGAGVRGWVQSPVRGEARPKMQPTGQVGVVWGLGGR